jgi:hypothetical protein
MENMSSNVSTIASVPNVRTKVVMRGYNMLTRTVTVEWYTGAEGLAKQEQESFLTWELQVQRWSRYGDEVVADWTAAARAGRLTATVTNKVFVDLQQYLYAFRVQAINNDGSRGAPSSTEGLYGEPAEKNNLTASVKEGFGINSTSLSDVKIRSAGALQQQTVESLNVRTKAPQELILGSGFPLVKRGHETFAILKAVQVSVELDVQRSFPTFYSWAHEALPLLRVAISTYLNASASASITSYELFLGSRVRKYAALEVSVLVLPESSAAEYEREVNMVRDALQALHGGAAARLVELFKSELGSRGVLIPGELTLVRTSSTEVCIEDKEFEVDMADGGDVEVEVDMADGDMAEVDMADGSVFLKVAEHAVPVVLVSVLAIIFLYRKYWKCSKGAAAELHDVDLEKQAADNVHQVKVTMDPIAEDPIAEDDDDDEKQAANEDDGAAAVVLNEDEALSEFKRCFPDRAEIRNATNAVQVEKKQLPTLLVSSKPASNGKEIPNTEAVVRLIIGDQL